MGSGSDTSPKKTARSKSLPRGKYTYVGIDIDTTGRRLIDEIVQLSAYHPSEQFSQYIMPYMNLNPAARQRHQVRVITIGFFRMLKSMQTYKVVKTKSEIAALMDFLMWLEKLKNNDKDSNGIIFVYHEQRKFVPYMILEAFKKYNLQQRFLSTVRSFANGYTLAETKCGNTMKYFSLRQLSKVFLNNEDENSLTSTTNTSPPMVNLDHKEKEKEKEKLQFEGNASVRAKLIYEIIQHLAKGEQQDLCTESMENELMGKILYEYATPVSQDIGELRIQKQILERQNSLRPVFLQYFKTTLYYRVKAVTFRRVLAEFSYDFETLEKIWQTNKKDGIKEAIDKIVELKEEERQELIDLLDCHFDPDKQPVKPVVKKQRRRSTRRNIRRSTNKENFKPSRTSESETPISPDSTVKTPIKKIQQGQNRPKYSPINSKGLSSNL